MTQQEHHTQSNTDRTSYSFQTLNMTMKDKPSQHAVTPKFFKPVIDILKRIHWFTLLLILILGWSGYQVMRRSPSKYQWVQEGWYHVTQWASTKAPAMPVPTASVVEPAIAPKKMEVEVVSTSPKTEPVKPNNLPQTTEPVRSNAPPAIVKAPTQDKSLQEMNQRIVHMETSVKQLNLQMAALQRNARALDNQIRRLNQTVTMLSSVAAESSRSAQATPSSSGSNVAAPVSDQAPSQPTSKTKAESDYTLHAVIPGRAWLNTPEGKIITVSVGSPLPHYGAVQTIDSTQGVVYCSTGATIKFSTQEY